MTTTNSNLARWWRSVLAEVVFQRLGTNTDLTAYCDKHSFDQLGSDCHASEESSGITFHFRPCG